MFVARIRETGERVDITTVDNPRSVLPLNGMTCQRCEETVTIRAGQKVRAHFAHRATATCHGEYDAHPETPFHHMGKELIAGLMRQELREYCSAPIEYEVPIPEAKRIADVVLKLPCGWWIAFECQLAHITPAELEQRTHDYLGAGVDVVWWLGGAADRPENHRWCYQHQGSVFRLTFHRANDTTSVLPYHVTLSTSLMDTIQVVSVPYEIEESYQRPFVSTFHEKDVRRMFEVWEELTVRQIRMGLGAENSRSNHINGILGSMNARKVITRSDHGQARWRRIASIAELRRASPRGYTPLPPSAWHVIRSRAAHFLPT